MTAFSLVPLEMNGQLQLYTFRLRTKRERANPDGRRWKITYSYFNSCYNLFSFKYSTCLFDVFLSSLISETHSQGQTQLEKVIIYFNVLTGTIYATSSRTWHRNVALLIDLNEYRLISKVVGYNKIFFNVFFFFC